MLLLGCQSVPADLSSLKQPEAKTLCDQYVCANSEGISKALTQKYLGQAQANQVFSQGEFDHTQFTFANGVFCDTKMQSCYVDRYFDADGKRSAVAPKYTKALFGK